MSRPLAVGAIVIVDEEEPAVTVIPYEELQVLGGTPDPDHEAGLAEAIHLFAARLPIHLVEQLPGSG
jgi:hypothetical protein